jgi:hypothetical protein
MSLVMMIIVDVLCCELTDPMHSISFTHLYLALASSIHEESSLLLFYTLLHRNKSFREFVFAKSDVDGN